MKKDETILWIRENVKVPKAKAALLVAGNAVFSVCTIIFALLCRGAIDHAVSGETNITLGSAAGLAIIVVIQLGLRLLCNSIEESAKARVENDLRRDMLEKLMKKEYAGISEFQSEELLSRMFPDISVISDGVVGIFPAFINIVTRLVCAAAVMLLLDAEFAALFIAAGAVYFLISRVLVSKTKTLRRDVSEKEESARQMMRETLDGLLTIRTFGAESKAISTNREKQNIYYNSRMKRRAASIAAGAGFSFAFQAGYLYALIWGAFSILNGTMTFGTLVAVLQLVNQIQTPYAGISTLAARYYSMLGSAERLIELDILPGEKSVSGTLAADDFECLYAKNASFAYGENVLFRDVSFEIDRGEIVGIDGNSGSGKTTLVMMLIGVHHPFNGDIRFVSRQGEFVPGAQTRGLIAYVPRDNGVFSGTVRENITFLNENARTDEIRSAAKTACVLEYIEALPDGFETKVGEGGIEVSRGIMQRLAIARAVLSGAPLIVIDGATNILSEDAEAEILENISALKNRTVIAVLNRSAALRVCDKRLRIQDGGISEARSERLLSKRA